MRDGVTDVVQRISQRPTRRIRRPAGQHLVEDHAQGVEIALRIDLVQRTGRLFG
jgi:hypothetical protein